MKIEKRNFTAGPVMEAVLKAIPVYPDAINVGELRELLHAPQRDKILGAIFSFPSSLPICEDENDYCYVDEEARQFTFNAYGFI